MYNDIYYFYNMFHGIKLILFYIEIWRICSRNYCKFIYITSLCAYQYRLIVIVGPSHYYWCGSEWTNTCLSCEGPTVRNHKLWELTKWNVVLQIATKKKIRIIFTKYYFCPWWSLQSFFGGLKYQIFNLRQT